MNSSSTGVSLTATLAVLGLAALSFGLEPVSGGGDATPAAAIDKPLIACWGFDEPFGLTCIDASGQGHHATAEGRSLLGLGRVEGIRGSALSLSGQHMLRVPGKPSFAGLPAVTICAWTQPTDLSVYREIFRKEDGESRVLFSFQHDGTILSLGLNVGGYVECDAPIDPAKVLDGGWHHCAGTFDGKTFRVYLDGKEVGRLDRPGSISAGGDAPGCIGSSNGGECFQGLMDDLEIYAAALTPEEIGRIHEAGLRALERLAEPVGAGEPSIGRRLLAHWSFNEQSGKVLHDVSGARPAPDSPASVCTAKGPLFRTKGVHGSALDLHGAHSLEVALGREIEGASSVAFSAWVKPADLSGFREIFRQECAERLLFSFQANGTILSLGLNVGGYVECDAPLDPAKVLDGGWHHAAGTFDGEWMRVYLDGEEIGSLRRPGKLAASTAAPAFIGSSGGTGEHFQGGLDDLRIFTEAPAAEEIALLHRSGRESVERLWREAEKAMAALYAKRASFAETLSGARKSLAENQLRLDRDLAEAFLRKLRADFPDECRKLAEWTGSGPLDFLAAPDDSFQIREAERLVELCLEYMPLTEGQVDRLTPAEREHCHAAGEIHARIETLKAAGDSAKHSPEWLQLILDAGARIQPRPAVHEPVAPYVKPRTPETRSLSAEEAREALRRDWLHQADGNPTAERARSEIQWARQLAGRICARRPGAVDCAPEIAALDDLERQLDAASGPTASELYFKVREVKRRIALKNPAVDFDKVVFVDMPYPQGSEWPHETRHRLGYMAVPGGRLLILEGLSPEGKLVQLMPRLPLHGSFWRPDVSYDAAKVLFCFKPHNEKSFHLYEIGADGSGLVQLTSGPFDDFDPIYLPDEKHIIFSTTRAHTYVRCMPPTNAYVLARCDRDGRNIYLISQNNEPDYLPSVMGDGRVIYTRWEYTDKPLWRAQKLWTMNPDGTQVAMFWGNQSVWPDLVKDARTIPGSQRVMVTGSAHHNWFSGSVGIIDVGRGLNFPGGITKVTADLPWPECGNGPVDPVESPEYHRSGDFPAYYSPYPLGEEDFLVSANRGGKFCLYLMDVRGNRELIYEGTNNIFHAIALKPRARPPVLADRVAWPTREERLNPKGGILFSSNVYEGAPAELKGLARYLRILHIEPKTYTYWYKRPYISTGPVVSAVQSEGVKRILGTVPIEEDGSVAFQVPSGIPLHFQLLDEDQRALHTMRSFVGVLPGERRGCLGCHESHSRAPHTQYGGLALRRDPSEITPPIWGSDTVSYPRYVQPVLDKYCGGCHQGDGEARKTLDLTLRPGFDIFTEPYLTLIGRPTWGEPYRLPPDPGPGFGIAGMLMVEGYSTVDPLAYVTPKPMTRLSRKSRLVEIASSGKHHDVQVDAVSLARIVAWVDAMCPYIGDEEIRQIPDPVFQGVDWLAIRPRIQTAPRIVRPGPVD